VAAVTAAGIRRHRATSGRIESTRDDFQAPPGGELEMTASTEQPDPANGLGYWPTIYATTTTRTGGTQTLNVSGSGRYIRMQGTVRATQYGYFIYEFQLYGS
jgi:hypothetical protein